MMFDKELGDSPGNENVDPNTPPSGSPIKASKTGSPTHKSMWDSGDPSRNPPPLPASPQMIRIKPNNNRSTSPSSVGKLQFATLDNSEIEYQLKRIIDAQSNLRNIVIGVDNSVKQTQLDLEQLVERSSNNNFHLKDLVNNVKNSAVNENTSITPEHIQESITKAITPIQEHNYATQQLREYIMDKLESLNFKANEPTNTNDEVLKDIKSSVEDLTTKLEAIRFMHTEHANLLKGFEDEITSQVNENGKINASISESRKSVIESVSKVESAIADLGLEAFIEDSSSKHNDLLNHLDTSKSAISDTLERHLSVVKCSNDSLSKNLMDSYSTGHETHSKHITDVFDLIKANQFDSSKISDLEERINKHFKNSHTELADDLKKKLQSLHEQSVESTNLEGTLNTTLKTEFASLSTSLETKFDELKKHLDEPPKDIQLEKEIENKDLSIQLKDKEIAELKAQLEQLQKAKKIEDDIYDLVQTKAKLETNCESLSQAYTKRYREFKELSSDYDVLQQKLYSISLDKIKNILGSATIMKISNENNSPSEKVESPRKNVLANRVLSTNSYLDTTHIQLTPTSKKKYELSEAFEEKENI